LSAAIAGNHEEQKRMTAAPARIGKRNGRDMNGGRDETRRIMVERPEDMNGNCDAMSIEIPTEPTEF